MTMRTLAFVLLAACDLQPPPPAPAANPPPVVAVTAPAPAAAPVAVVEPPTVGASTRASVPPVSIDVTPACVETGSHVAEAIIASAKDPQLRASYEQGRTKIVRATAEACTKQHWSPEAQHCYGTAKLEADVRACEAKFPPPAAAMPAHPPAPVTAKKSGVPS